jgi:hypothetical protein
MIGENDPFGLGNHGAYIAILNPADNERGKSGSRCRFVPGSCFAEGKEKGRRAALAI